MTNQKTPTGDLSNQAVIPSPDSADFAPVTAQSQPTAPAPSLDVTSFLRSLGQAVAAAPSNEPAGPGMGPATVPGGRYIIDGEAYSADGKPIK